MSGSVLNWFYSYSFDRSFSVAIGSSQSSHARLACGVPQGSVLGPLLFSLNMLPLGHIIRSHNLSFHPYADDTQLYLSFNPNDFNHLNTLRNCINDITCWMSQNFLQLNLNKTEVLIVGPGSEEIKTHLGSLSNSTYTSCRILGVIFDENLSLNQHVNLVVQSCFMQLRKLSKLTFLSSKNLEVVIHALFLLGWTTATLCTHA